MENVKIISSGNYWICENMDTLAPIIEKGTEYLLSDGTTRCFKDNIINDEDFAHLKWATLDEAKKFASQKYGYIFKGDKVIINRGRKMRGEVKIVKGYYEYIVRGTYGHVSTKYLLFTDGTKVNIRYCDVVDVEHDDKTYYIRRYEENFDRFIISVGGRK